MEIDLKNEIQQEVVNILLYTTHCVIFHLAVPHTHTHSHTNVNGKNWNETKWGDTWHMHFGAAPDFTNNGKEKRKLHKHWTEEEEE